MSAPPPKPNLREKLALIDRYLARGDVLAAEVTARQLLAAYPRRAEANHGMGLVLSLLCRPELAEDLLRRAEEAEKTNPEYRLDLGQGLLAMGRVVEAEAHYERARALAPASARVHWKWGAYLLLIGRGTRRSPPDPRQREATVMSGRRPAGKWNSELMLRRGELGAVMSPALMRGAL